MNHPGRITLLLILSVCAVAISARAKDSAREAPVPTSSWSDAISKDRLETTARASALHATAVANTLVLASYRFESGSTCNAQGWTAVDLGPSWWWSQFAEYGQKGPYWHVDDFAPSNSLGSIVGSWMSPPGQSANGITFNPLTGSKSMWCGQRIPPAGPIDPIHCSYKTLPGYGTLWNQSFVTKDCLSVAAGPTSELDISFKMKFDTQPSYDMTWLEYTHDCSGESGWIELDGDYPWSGADSLIVSGPYVIPGTDPIRVRIRFASDTAFSNQDGLYPGFGVAIDDLSIEDLPVEDFEGEAVGANEGEHWTAHEYTFGNYLGLFKQTTGANYEDECNSNISCYWAAIQGSTEFYTCGVPPQPTQRIVPHGNVRGEYLGNEIWSPIIPLSGSGSEFRLRYAVYRDLPYDNLVFHRWRVRTTPASGCPGFWRDRQLVYYGDTKDWATVDHAVGTLMDVSTAVSMQVAIGILDMCQAWCGVSGSGACHSPAPYIDSVQILRVDTAGPQWDVRAIDTYQDTFAANGTITGTARIDTAIDVKPAASPTFTPGDSALVLYLVDPKYIGSFATLANGLLADPNISTFIGRHKTKRQAYMWVQVWPYDGVDNPGDKVGADLSDGPGGQANRYPFAGTQTINGTLWTKIRMDYTYTGTATNPGIGDTSQDAFIRNRFNVDLNDNLFTPGDTILYFFGATSADGSTYYSSEYGSTSSIGEIAANPMEVTILPAGGYNRGGDILYVDGADGEGVQAYYDGAFLVLGIEDLVDRYDVRSPSSGHANRLSGRVTSIQNQLNDVYSAILWDTGPLSFTLGDGSGSPLKTNDYLLLNTYLANGWATQPGGTNGGVILLGDRLAEALTGYAGAAAVIFRGLYVPFTLINPNHRIAPSLFAVSPAVKAWPGRLYLDDFTLFGGCAALNDFDVIGASGAARVEMSYNTASNANGAVISKQTAVTGGTATAIMAGFSLAYVRDDELNGISDRAEFLNKSFMFTGTSLGPTTGASDAPAKNQLSQNYPNPFNPATTIKFSLRTRGRVELNVYDVGGRLVRQLTNENRTAGAHTVTWDGRDSNGVPVASGVYFYRLTSGDFLQTRKMVLLK